MGGPYCETCKYFYQGPTSGDGGECEDPAKIIYSKGGQSSEKPWVYKKCECCNWTEIEGEERPHYGKDCPEGMVQVEFVMCDPKDKKGEYGWKPVEKTSVDIYVDGERYLVKVGDYHDGVAERRGLYVGGPIDMVCEKTNINTCSLFRKSTDEDKHDESFTCSDCGDRFMGSPCNDDGQCTLCATNDTL
ncbi:hypothetical protein SYK_07180 [Pseudodesulfovibrio nedwellii]|uniref:Uncharacterized protein n=1 Tax=Pseudodesulfovibrio nedwellii TaxID=2973072 RepID=A0ABM8AXY0_9BACT|nr:hypothetical protein [Pseudodesulfovibrio nedwellii]BDQ36358.1 hypothetical protein SYK_07180 [Pseudodesulfovibrio nedwellii]